MGEGFLGERLAGEWFGESGLGVKLADGIGMEWTQGFMGKGIRGILEVAWEKGEMG